MKTVLLSGYYGFNNIGDEAVLGGILAGMRAELPDVTPVVLSGDPEGTRKLHGVEAIPHMRFAEIRAALRHADLFVSGGGSLLQDVTSFRSPLYYLYLIWLAQRMRVPTMMLAQGVGPLHAAINRSLAKRVLNRLRTITVRDAASAEYLRTMGVTRPPVAVTADPSFLLAPDHSAGLAEWWRANIPANRPLVGVALRSWQTEKSAGRYAAIADALDALARNTGALLLFLPMQYDADLPVAEEMAARTAAESRVLKLPFTPREMLAAVGRCDFILAMRLHTLIFAVQQSVPALGLAYDPKVVDFSLAAELPSPMPWEAISGDLTAMLQQRWDDRESLRTTLAVRSSELVAKAKVNISRLKEMLG